MKYGFLGGVGKGVVLGLEDVKEVVGDVAAELESRGMSIAFEALDSLFERCGEMRGVRS